MSASWEDFKRKVLELRNAEKIAVENLQQALKTCLHEEKLPKSKYNSGDYYNRASTERWLECVVCGKQSDYWATSHNYYG